MIQSRRVVCLIQARLHEMIVRRVFTVSGQSCGAPFGAHLDVGLAKRRTPCRFVGNLTSPSLSLGEDGRL